MNFFRGIRTLDSTPRRTRKELITFTAEVFLTRFGTDVIIEPSDAAAETIRVHQGYRFNDLQWAGECLGKNALGEYMWYYVAGTGPLHIPTTQVLVLAK